MKKLFSILLTLAMLLNVGIVAMAADVGEVVLSLDFETESTNLTYNSSKTKITGIDGIVKTYLVGSSWIVGYEPEGHDGSTKSIRVNNSRSDGYYGVCFESDDLETGAIYEFSAWVKTTKKDSGQLAITTASEVRDAYAVSTKSNNVVTKVGNRWRTNDNNTVSNTAGGVTAISASANTWTEFKGEFLIPFENETTSKTAAFAFTGLDGEFLVDDVCIKKTGSFSINGDSEIVKPVGDNVSTATYTVSTDTLGVGDVSDLELIGDYGTSVEISPEGVLTVKPDVAVDTITLGIYVPLHGSSGNTPTLMATKEIRVKDCQANAEGNLLTFGCFEKPADLEELAPASIFYDDVTNGKLPLVVEHVNDPDQAYCGNGSILVKNQRTYHPANFKATLKEGSVYKFRAYIKIAEGSYDKLKSVSLYANTTQNAEGSPTRWKGVYVFDEEGAKHDAGYDYNTKYTTAISFDKYVKFERYIYVSDELDANENGEATVYIGIKHTNEGKLINYYLDEVSLIKVGEFDGADGIDIPADSTNETYTFIKEAGIEDDVTVGLKADYEGVSFDAGALTVGSTAAPGRVYVQAKIGDVIIAEKEVALFDGTGVLYSNGEVGSNTLFTMRVSKTASPLNPVFLLANYGSSGTAYKKVSVNNLQSMDGCWEFKGYVSTSTGTNKVMIWNGINTMIPVTNAVEVVR